MEKIWLKTEPSDNKFDTYISIKSEDDVNVIGAGPSRVIPTIKEEQLEDEDKNTLEIVDQSIEFVAAASEHTNGTKQKLTAAKGGSVKKKVKKKSGVKTSKSKQFKEKSTDKISSSSKKVEKKTGSDKCTKPKPKIFCEECGKSFSGISGLNRHKIVHTGEKPHVCNECGKAFAQKTTLQQHQMSHTGERRFFCEECGAKFASKFYMKIHQRSHAGELPFVCEECGEAFSRRQGLERHKLGHTGEKRFECDECGMKFYEKLLLKSHKKTHTADKPFQCTECGKGFYHKTSLNAHARAHSSERPFGCDVCGKRFTQKGTLTVHKVIHSDVRPYGCDICGLRFTQKFTLKAHAMKQHGRLPAIALKRQKTQKTQSKPSAMVAELKSDKSHNDKIPSDGCERVLLSESNAQHPMDNSFTQKTSLLRNGNDLNESKGTLQASQSGVKAQQVEDTSEIEISSSSESEPEDAFGVNSPSSESVESIDVSTGDEFSERFMPECKIEIQEPERSDRIRLKDETDTVQQQFFGIPKSEPMTTTHENVNVMAKSPDKSSKKRNSAGQAESSVDLPFPCKKCERKFAMIGALKNHQRSHNSKAKKEESVICDECGKIFTKAQHLKLHKRIHSEEQPYSCDLCDKRFNQLANYRTHRKTHSNERPFSCDLCGKAFARKNTVEKHMLSHTKEKRFQCDLCGRKFLHFSSVKKHKLSHTNEKRYGCDVCGKKFFEKSYIKYHMRTHTGYKPFQCDECPSSFVDKSQLTQHKGYSHRKAGEPSPRQRRNMVKMMKMMDAALSNNTVV